MRFFNRDNHHDSEEVPEEVYAPLQPTEWERDLDKPTFERRPYSPRILSNEEANARLELMGKGEMSIALPPADPPADVTGPGIDPDPSEEWPTIKWLDGPPTVSGAYWIRDGAGTLAMVTVRSFGGRLSIVTRAGDGATYRSVSVMKWRWAGPVPTPDDVAPEELEDRLEVPKSGLF